MEHDTEILYTGTQFNTIAENPVENLAEFADMSKLQVVEFFILQIIFQQDSPNNSQ